MIEPTPTPDSNTPDPVVIIEPMVVIERDYDGAFERTVRRWMAAKVGPFKHDEIRINSGPYRSSAVSYASSVVDGRRVLAFDFYSALRTGFGSLSEQDVTELVALL
jgi:hypothetical protein